MSLKVLMVGGRRCGKTSALGTTFEQIINGVANNYFTISDDTQYVTKSDAQNSETQDVLATKQLELQLNLENPTSNIFLVDSGPTYFDWVYKLKLTKPGTTNSLDMEFIDVPGEWFESGAGAKTTAAGLTVRDQMMQYIKDADVYVIMVDVPMLMNDSDALAKAANCVDGIHSYLTNIESGPKKHKLVIFSPIKCEYWVKNKKMNEVVDRMMYIYDTVIKSLKAHSNMDICILPIQTAGNIVFFESTPAYVLTAPGQDRQKCHKLDDTMVRLSDGSIREKRAEEVINPDPASMTCGLPRPYTWFEINFDVPAGASLYAPENCDQLPLHILRFYFKKFMTENSGGLLAWLWKLLFGGISKNDLQQILVSMSNKGVIKDNVDNITYIKRSLIV